MNTDFPDKKKQIENFVLHNAHLYVNTQHALYATFEDPYTAIVETCVRHRMTNPLPKTLEKNVHTSGLSVVKLPENEKRAVKELQAIRSQELHGNKEKWTRVLVLLCLLKRYRRSSYDRVFIFGEDGVLVKYCLLVSMIDENQATEKFIQAIKFAFESMSEVIVEDIHNHIIGMVFSVILDKFECSISGVAEAITETIKEFNSTQAQQVSERVATVKAADETMMNHYWQRLSLKPNMTAAHHLHTLYPVYNSAILLHQFTTCISKLVDTNQDWINDILKHEIELYKTTKDNRASSLAYQLVRDFRVFEENKDVQEYMFDMFEQSCTDQSIKTYRNLMKKMVAMHFNYFTDSLLNEKILPALAKGMEIIPYGKYDDRFLLIRIFVEIASLIMRTRPSMVDNFVQTYGKQIKDIYAGSDFEESLSLIQAGYTSLLTREDVINIMQGSEGVDWSLFEGSLEFLLEYCVEHSIVIEPGHLDDMLYNIEDVMDYGITRKRLMLMIKILMVHAAEE
jgi:hypothetical protein